MDSKREAQLASAVLMIRPARFESNPMTAESNAFQTNPDMDASEQQAKAAVEFDAISDALEQAGIRVIREDDTREPHTPDSVFPNNWVTFHGDGRVVLYPMEAENRRTERRLDIVERMATDYGYTVSEVVDLSDHEKRGQFLEGTGSLVLDRANRIAYACLSSRTHLEVLGDFAQRMDYEVIAFEAVDRNGDPIYHTNVMMSLGSTLAVICSGSIPDATQRDAVLKRLADTGHEIVDITFDQLEAFAGNMLELVNQQGEPVMAMSEQARRSLRDDQLAAIERHAKIVSAPIDTIELSAGGSVRCMLAEIHLPPAATQGR